MSQMMGWRQAAKVLGIAEGELYRGLRSGRYPGLLCGSRRGRWVVNVEQVRARIDQLMQENIQNDEQVACAGVIRKVT